MPQSRGKTAAGVPVDVLCLDDGTVVTTGGVPLPGSDGTKLIQTINGNGVLTAADFLAIPNIYSHLRIVFECRSAKPAVNNESLFLRFNGDNGNNYYSVQFFHRHNNSSGDTEVVAGSAIHLDEVPAAAATAKKTCGGEIIIPNYKNAEFHKNARKYGWFVESELSAGLMMRDAHGGWKSTGPINRVQLYVATGPFLVGSIFSLYGMT